MAFSVSKIIKSRIRDSNKSDAVSAVHLECNRDNFRESPMIALLWLSADSRGTKILEEMHVDDHAYCFVAIDYFDFRPWPEESVHITTITYRDGIELLEEDSSGEWKIVIPIADPYLGRSALDKEHYCDYDRSEAIARKRCLEKIECNLQSGYLTGTPKMIVNISIT